MSAKSVIEALQAQSERASVFGFEEVASVHFVTVFSRLFVAFGLGAFVSFRPWRALIPARRRPAPRAIESVQAQTLIAVAGALMVSVIGNNMARAFGLVGLGAFIRFRSGIKDPRDAAVMFVMIGIGMACGLGNVPMALIAAGFCGVVLALFDATGRPRMRHVRVAIDLADARAELDAVRAALPGARVLALPTASGDLGQVVLELDMADDEDASSLVAQLEDHHVAGVRRVAIEEGRLNGNGG